MDETKYTCTRCTDRLAANMFATVNLPDGRQRRDGWCLDCRAETRSQRPSAAPRQAASEPKRLYRNARNRARVVADRRLREENPQLYAQYITEARQRHPLPDKGRARAAAHSRHNSQATRRLRADFPARHKQYVEEAMALEGYELGHQQRATQ